MDIGLEGFRLYYGFPEWLPNILQSFPREQNWLVVESSIAAITGLDVRLD